MHVLLSLARAICFQNLNLAAVGKQCTYGLRVVPNDSNTRTHCCMPTQLQEADRALAARTLVPKWERLFVGKDLSSSPYQKCW